MKKVKIGELPDNAKFVFTPQELKEYMKNGKKMYAYGGFISKAKLFASSV